MNLKCKITRLLVEAAKLGFLSLPQTQKAYQWKITGMPLWVGCYNQHWRLGDEHQTSWVAKNICTAVSGLCTNPRAYHKRCESNGQTQPIRMIEKSENNINDKVKKIVTIRMRRSLWSSYLQLGFSVHGRCLGWCFPFAKFVCKRGHLNSGTNCRQTTLRVHRQRQ